MRITSIVPFSAVLIGVAFVLSSCGTTTLNCQPDDDPCIQRTISSPSTIDQFAVLSQYRYPVRFDPSKAREIPRAEALAYLNKAVSVADRSYALCGYSNDSVLFANVAQPIAFSDVQIIPAHGEILNQENYVIFIRYQPGTALLFNSVACIAYRRVLAPGADASFIPNEMESVTEALLSIGAKLEY